jgi:1,4-dihydroxy-2-naphthoyl-CoA hydrolase
MGDRLTGLEELLRGTLPDYLGLEWIEAREGFVKGRVKIETRHLAPNGFLHAAMIVLLADSACGYGCMVSLPQGATSFTTIELKTNFLGTARDDAIAAEARLIHGGRTTQVWDAEVTRESDGKTIALFRCTQILLYARSE